MTLPNDDTPKPDKNAIDVDATDMTDADMTDTDAVVEDALERETQDADNQDADNQDADNQDADNQDADYKGQDIEYADAEILPPIKVEPKKGLGFKSLLTATVFAGLLGAGGGFGLSYYLLPKLSPPPDTSRLETKITTLSQNNQDVSTQIERLEQSVRDISRQAEVAGLTDSGSVDMRDIDMRDIETRLEALETQNPEAQNPEARNSETQNIGSVIEAVDPSTFMYGDRLLRDILQEILENQIALQSAVEATSETKEAALTASKTVIDSTNNTISDISDVNPASVDTDSAKMASEKTSAQSETPKKNKSTLSDDSKASGSKSVIGSMTTDAGTMDAGTVDGGTMDSGAVAMNTKPSGSVKSGSVKSESVKSDGVPRADGTLDTGTPDYIKSRSDSNTTRGIKTGGARETVEDMIIKTQAEETIPSETISSESVSENVTVSSTVVLPEFPEEALRAAVRDHELAGKNWFARIIGKNLSIKKAGERDAIDDIVDLIARKDIAGALDKMETLPSSVRSVARDWIKAARQVR